MPTSPCGPGCIESVDQVSGARMLLRLTGIAGVLFSYPVVHVCTPARSRSRVQRRYARMLLRCLGIRLRIIDNGQDGYGAGALVVTGHIGWTDIVALAAVQPVGFVARADMIDWPLLGGLARLMRVIPIERERLRELPEVVGALAERLRSGDSVVVFPEGTTWCGRAYGTMRPALFQSAIDAGAPVQPVRLRYLDREETQCTVPGFVGVDTFASSARRVLATRGMTVEITLEPVEEPGEDRRELARRCERAVRGAELHHGHGWIEATTTRVQDPETAAVAEPAVRRPRRRLLPGRRHRSTGAQAVSHAE
ncbi:1-acyl-sn-glycerol-3-phosphate acyltransferase [Nocardia panacis]|uniref:1-acyl-sn-glycerol-3-phosphate acyltransferase n=2 Tax=Nocardia panacis TaxID=2340916 RepID=A0A3A4KK60_9NOCA|nr:1-acyl-sn-glycerol-3-phosphate acyltransferase [Nocardia panacis]